MPVYETDLPTPVLIPDNDPGGVEIPFGIVDSFLVERFEVALYIEHTYVSDLLAILVAPDGTETTLFESVGGDEDNLGGGESDRTVIDSASAVSIYTASHPFVGTYAPDDLSVIGKEANGTWKLRIVDPFLADEGIVQAATVTIHTGLDTFTELDPTGTGGLLAEGWFADADNPAVYLHRGRAYMQGIVVFAPSGDYSEWQVAHGRELIPTGGLPLHYRPSSPQTVKLWTPTASVDPVDYNRYWMAEVRPDGGIAILPGTSTGGGTVPGDENYHYPQGATLPRLLLTDASWPVTPIDDSLDAGVDLDDYLYDGPDHGGGPDRGDWSGDPSAAFHVHNARVHLSGRIALTRSDPVVTPDPIGDDDFPSTTARRALPVAARLQEAGFSGRQLLTLMTPDDKRWETLIHSNGEWTNTLSSPDGDGRPFYYWMGWNVASDPDPPTNGNLIIGENAVTVATGALAATMGDPPRAALSSPVLGGVQYKDSYLVQSGWFHFKEQAANATEWGIFSRLDASGNGYALVARRVDDTSVVPAVKRMRYELLRFNGGVVTALVTHASNILSSSEPIVGSRWTLRTSVALDESAVRIDYSFAHTGHLLSSQSYIDNSPSRLTAVGAIGWTAPSGLPELLGHTRVVELEGYDAELPGPRDADVPSGTIFVLDGVGWRVVDDGSEDIVIPPSTVEFGAERRGAKRRRRRVTGQSRR